MGVRSLSDIKVQIEHDRVIVQGHRFPLPNIAFAREVFPRGANGIVFEAFDAILQRRVAIKIWVPRQNDIRDKHRQALAEARKVARLNHRNIVQIYSCGELHNGWIYSVMEFLEGETLQEYLRLERPTFAVRVRIWREIEEALEHAYCHGIYHGDLHDRNVILVNGTAKVIDFGTSLFASGRIISRLRESTKLLRLGKKIFSKYQPAAERIIDVRIGELKPELALGAISTWVSVLWDWQGLLTAKDLKDQDRVITAITGLAFDVCRAPVFSVFRIVDQLAGTGFSKRVQEYFIAYCLLWAEVRLQQLKDNTKNPMMVFEHNITLDDKANRVSLEELWPSLRAGFCQFGPFT